MQVTLISGFSKRINSTKRPSGGTTVDCLMKDPTDLHNPTIKVNTSATNYNYMIIEEHYFYITNVVVMPAGWVEFTGTVDAMATCADDIKSTTAFIERSNSFGRTDLVDSLSPGGTDIKSILSHTTSLPWSFGISAYIVNFTNLLQPAVMTEGEISALYEDLNNPSIYQQLKDLLTGGIENFITGAMWLPIMPPRGGSTALKTNSLDLGISVNLLLMKYDVGTVVVEFPGILGSAYGSSAYCDMSVYLPFVGTVKLSVDDFIAAQAMEIQVGIDYSTGGIVYIITSGGNPVASFNGSCGTSVGIGYSGSNLLATAGGAIVSLAGIAAESMPLALGGGAMMFNGLKGSTGQLSAAAGNKAFAMDTNIHVGIFQKSLPESYTRKKTTCGLPTYQTAVLGTCSGFVKTINASITTKHLDCATECNAMLDGGAWIE